MSRQGTLSFHEVTESVRQTLVLQEQPRDVSPNHASIAGSENKPIGHLDFDKSEMHSPVNRPKQNNEMIATLQAHVCRNPYH